MRNWIALHVVVLLGLTGTMAGQKSKFVPGFSLGNLSEDQCSYALTHINRLTQFVEQPETFQGNGLYPGSQEGVDAFVADGVRDIYTSLLFLPLERDDPKEFKRLKMDVKLKEMTFAYVLELRGCAIDPTAIKFVK